ncbi:hypothetical protein [Mycoplasma sp. 5370]
MKNKENTQVELTIKETKIKKVIGYTSRENFFMFWLPFILFALFSIFHGIIYAILPLERQNSYKIAYSIISAITILISIILLIFFIINFVNNRKALKQLGKKAGDEEIQLSLSKNKSVRISTLSKYYAALDAIEQLDKHERYLKWAKKNSSFFDFLFVF